MMIDTETIFRYKVPDEAKLLDYGFSKANGKYSKIFPIMKKQFTMHVIVETDVKSENTEYVAGSANAENGFRVNFKVVDNTDNEEYTLVKVESAHGKFVADARAACEKVLTDISAKCFNTEKLKAEQTGRVLKYIKETYSVEPEFLWDRFPDYAALRRPDNEKWFAAIMTLDRSKLGFSEHGNIEVIDLKDTPENVETRFDGERFLKGFHMNKKHWYTVCLDGRVEDEELFRLIDISYGIVK